ncbi:sigma-70 family RNA polymerase sigma factor [Blastopirellula marina]|uniref:RNA polymerase subunit sigma-70 n=1 Tax=Blastopirellula marina TaxID=124 RepID=A0A2S8FA31_9BACT|nr:sigma-70 family RNA polymerase sigma factor [Blastopirellula marina]PQO29023.1 RNA polymerase subunit sigma-70 [Blastopirellula marina]PTL42295.1 RNA polymerase subunit sigma-70 [Blastopirellula marina]
MAELSPTEQFIQLLTENQNRIYGYIFSLLGERSQTADVLQETNLVLWRKFADYDSRRPFLPWAFSIARFQVLANLRDRKRDRILLDPELVETISSEAESIATQFESIREALHRCLQRLSDSNRELIERRYFEALSLDEMAENSNSSAGAIKVALLRVRRQLAQCIQHRMASEGGA